MKLETPTIAKNVYRDLRDRRLLSIAIVLIVAIIAVPFLIKSDEEAPPPPVASSGAPVEGSEVLDAAVLTEQPVLRDFRKRLDRYRTNNPFKQQLTTSPVSGLDDLSESGASGGTTSTDTGSTVDDSALEPTTEAPTTDTGTEPEEPIDPGATPPDDGDSGGSMLVTTRVDVRFGTVGDSKVFKNVKPLDFLPDRQGAVVEYLQSDFNLTMAVFTVSPLVTTSEGEGKCAPSPQSCEFVQLDVGQEHSFQYDGERYRLKLLDTYLHEQPVQDGDIEDNDREGDFSPGAPAGRVDGG